MNDEVVRMKKQLIIVGIALVLIVVGLSGCTEEDALSGLGYVNREYGFGINPPEGWTINESSSIAGTIVKFETPINGDDYALFVIGTPTYLFTGETLSELIDLMIENYNISFTNFSLISKNSRTINGMDAYEFVYVFDRTLTVKQKEIVIEENPENVHLLIYNASPDSYDKYISMIDQSVDSFTTI